MAKPMPKHFNRRTNPNMPLNHRTIWPQRHNLPNRPFTRHLMTPPFLDNDFNFWCETCDKGFRTAAHLEYHISLHQKCNIDGCQFVAHPKVITRHIQMQHATGLFKKIGRLNNPEEIMKWREERKKKYPTKENIEKKQAEIKEKVKRGERMGMTTDKGHKNKVMQRKGKLQSRHKNILPMNNRRVTLTECLKPGGKVQKICKDLPPMENNKKLKPFMGIQDLLNGDNTEEDLIEKENNDLTDDEEYTQTNNVEDSTSTSGPALCGAITSLICNYGSSDEDDDEGTTQNCEKSDKLLHVNKRKIEDNQTSSKPNNNGFKIFVKPLEQLIDQSKVSQGKMDTSTNSKDDSDNDSGPEESSILRDRDSTNNENQITNKPKKRRVVKKQRIIRKNVNLRKKLPSTLLEKLLHREIQHERNVILQCVRYIVKNNYFDKD